MESLDSADLWGDLLALNDHVTQSSHIPHGFPSKLEEDLAAYLSDPPPAFSFCEPDECDVMPRSSVDLADLTPNTPLTPLARSHVHFMFPDTPEYVTSVQTSQDQTYTDPDYHYCTPQQTCSVLQHSTDNNQTCFEKLSDSVHPSSTSKDFLPSLHPPPPSKRKLSCVSKPETSDEENSRTCSVDTKFSDSGKKRKRNNSKKSMAKSTTKQSTERKRNTPASPAELHRKRRLAANARERKRMRSLNTAFDRLREVIPALGGDQIHSKYDTLQLAQTYIATLRNLLEDGDDMEAQ